MSGADEESLQALWRHLNSSATEEAESARWLVLLGGMLAVSAARRADSVAQALLRSTMCLFEASSGCLWRWSNAERSLSLWSRIPEKEGASLPLTRWRELAERTLFQTGYVITEPPLASVPQHSGLLSVVQWPVRYGDWSYGVLQVITRQQVDPAHALLGSVLAQQAAITMKRQEEAGRLKRYASMLETLRRVTLSLTSSLNLSEVLSCILEGVDEVVQGNLEDAHVFLYEEGRLQFGVARLGGKNLRAPIAQPRPDGLTARVARGGRPIVVHDTSADPLFKPWPEWRGSIVGLPLKIGERVVGVMNVAYRHPNAVGAEDFQALHLLADQAAIAIENAHLHRLVEQQAVTDALTHLPNRRALDARLREEVNRAERYGGQFCLLMIDLDGFKQINDRFGHPVGDRVLQQVATRLRKALRKSDFLARYGGDEFAMLLPQTDLDTAQAVAKKASQIVGDMILELPVPHPASISMSIGVACFPEHGATAADLLNAADSALYVAKDHPEEHIQAFSGDQGGS